MKPKKDELALRAEEFRKFRRDYLFSQGHLAQALKCSRRTIVNVEGAFRKPHHDLLRRFRILVNKHTRRSASDSMQRAAFLADERAKPAAWL